MVENNNIIKIKDTGVQTVAPMECLTTDGQNTHGTSISKKIKVLFLTVFFIDNVTLLLCIMADNVLLVIFLTMFTFML